MHRSTEPPSDHDAATPHASSDPGARMTACAVRAHASHERNEQIMSETKTAMMTCITRRLKALLCCSILLLGAATFCHAQIEQSTMILNGKLIVDSVGNGRLEASIKFNPP